jgi:hypothetical protein
MNPINPTHLVLMVMTHKAKNRHSATPARFFMLVFNEKEKMVFHLCPVCVYFPQKNVCHDLQ